MNGTRKLLRFEIAKMLIAVLQINVAYCVIYYNFRQDTFVLHKVCGESVPKIIKSVLPPGV